MALEQMVLEQMVHRLADQTDQTDLVASSRATSSLQRIGPRKSNRQKTGRQRKQQKMLQKRQPMKQQKTEQRTAQKSETQIARQMQTGKQTETATATGIVTATETGIATWRPSTWMVWAWTKPLARKAWAFHRLHHRHLHHLLRRLSLR